MKISVSSETIEYVLDNMGNIYLERNGNIYDFVVGTNNNLCIEKLPSHYFDNIVETKGDYEKTLELLSDPKSLKDHIDITGDIMEAKYMNDDAEHKYYYENIMYDEDDGEDEINDYNYNNEESVVFLYTNQDNKIKTIELCDSIPLYDIVARDGDLSSGSIVMKTKLVNQIPIYRMNICNDKVISFRSIGDEENIYDICLQDDELVLIKKESP